MNYAVIDLGSNTVRLSIFSYEDSKIITVIQQKEVVGLAGYVKKNRLELEGIHKACEVLRGFKEIASRFVLENDIHIFATASLRGIVNQDQALETIQRETGLIPEVLSGEEEARLGFVGASHYTECKDGILIDIGGASTELVRFEDAKPVQLASLPVGCLNLYTKYVEEVIPTRKERKIIKRAIREELDDLGWSIDKNVSLMIGVGGTVRATHKLSSELFSQPKDQQLIKTKYIKDIINKLRDCEDGIYRSVYKLIPERTLTISTGLMILDEAIKRFKCESMFISKYGIREGYMIDRIINERGADCADGER